MKKIIAIFIMLFAFSLSASAQTAVARQNNSTPEFKAKQNVFEMSKAIDTNGNDTFYTDMYRLFLDKYNALEKENITPAEKQEISNMIDLKLRATFNDNQIESLKTAGVYDKLLK